MICVFLNRGNATFAELCQHRTHCEEQGFPLVSATYPLGYPEEGQPRVEVSTSTMRELPGEAEREAVYAALSEAGRVTDYYELGSFNWELRSHFDALEAEIWAAVTRVLHILGAFPPTEEEQSANDLIAQILGV